LPNIEISADGRSILYANGMPRVYLWNERHTVRIGGRGLGGVIGGTISADGAHVLVVTTSGRYVLAQTSRPARTIRLRDPALRAALGGGQFSPDGTHVITVGGPTALVWSTSTGKVVRRLRSYVGAVTAASYSPDGKRIAIGGDDHTIVVRDARTYERLETIAAADTPRALVFSPDGQRILMGPQSFGAAVLYSCRSCEPVDAVMDDARRQVTRDLTRAEIRRFIDED
jgi:WD40 repeat protein